MLNPNIEMLENLISAAVSTRYKEVPPTEEEFLTLAQSMRATLSTLPVTDEEFAEILVRLRASIVIQMDVGVYINDRNTPHKSWLPSRRADLDFFFWNRYKKYLEEIKHLLAGCSYDFKPALHLGVSLRSFRSEKLAEFVKLLLDNKPIAAAKVYAELNAHYPIVMTRDYNKAKKWILSKARGTERYGLLASSEGKRLRGIGIWVPSEINHVGWFLNQKDNVDSSYFLEVAASEFKVQGLEIDYSLLAWDADLRRSDDDFDYFKFRGTRWNHVNNLQQQKYLKNAYRVLMTRARQGVVIFIPEGVDPEADSSRSHFYYDDIYKYLRSCGIIELE